MKIIVSILIFGAIILFHELGHFLLAKKHGVKVLEFSLGMGPRLLSTVRGETRYSLKALPFGGSCIMLGEEDPSPGREPVPGSINSLSPWKKVSVIAAGPIFNFILGFILALIIIASIGYVPARVVGFSEGSPAEAAGLREGDVITEYQGYAIDIGSDLYSYQLMHERKEEPVTLTYLRNGEERTLTYQPMVQEGYLLGLRHTSDSFMEVSALIPGMPLEETPVQAGDVLKSINGMALSSWEAYNAYLEESPLSGEPVDLVFEREGEPFSVTVTPKVYRNVLQDFSYNLASEKTEGWNVVKYSLIEVKYWIRTTIMSLKQLITGHFGIQDLSGPVGVVNEIGETYELSQSMGTKMVWMNMLNIAILLTANLGVMNLLPLPALDGGRLVFCLFEIIFRRPVKPEVEGAVHFVGFVLLMALMVVVMYNDLVRIF